MIRIDLGTEDLQGKGPKNPLKKLFDRLRMRNASSRAPADSYEQSSGGFGGKIAALGTIVLVLLALVGAAVPHVLFIQYQDFVIKKNEEQKKELEAQLASITKEISRLIPFQKELETYEAQKKLLRERLALIQNLLSARSTPVNVLDTVGQSLPTKAWLTSVDFDAKQARPVILLAGQSLNNDDVSDYLDKLSESVYLNEAVLDSLVFGKGSGIGSTTDVKIFQISLFPKGLSPIVVPKPPTPAAAPVVAPLAAAPEGSADLAAKSKSGPPFKSRGKK